MKIIEDGGTPPSVTDDFIVHYFDDDLNPVDKNGNPADEYGRPLIR